MNTWMAISEAEQKVAEQLMAEYFAEICDIDLALKAFTDNIARIVKAIANPEKIVASDENDVSNNIITQLTYSINEKIKYNHSHGVVMTAHTLAKDMVRMSLIEWLAINSDYSREDLIKFVYGGEKRLLSDVDLTRKIANIKWYDPCVGSGAFPLAVIDVFKSMGISIPPIIYGNDLNPLYVTATKIRVALTLNGDFDKNLEFIKPYFEVKDSLDTYSHHGNIFYSPKEINEFDIVIGNPPYVSGGKISTEPKNKYFSNYPQIGSKSSDLYTYFIAHGLNVLKKNGVLTFVSPAQFQMSNYGKGIRKDINRRAGLLTIADFNELPVFKNVSAHICVYSLGKHHKPETFLRFEFENLPQRNPLLSVYTDGISLSQQNASEEGWDFSSHCVHDILMLLSSKGVPLKEYCLGVYSGIKSGCKKAFYLNEEDISNLSEYDIQFIKKMYIPKKIRRWHGEWAGEYFAIIKKDQLIDESSKIFQRMLLYKEDLSARSDIQNHSTWYGLRECNYYNELFSPKILYPDISTECRFMMDTEGFFVPDGAFFIPGENYYLLGILNSCIGRYYFKKKCARIGNPQKGGRIRFKKVYVENFPVALPTTNTTLVKQIELIAKKATEVGHLDKDTESQLDNIALDLYQIPTEYRALFKET